MESSRQGKMPSLADLQTGIGDLGFEVIVINRAIDTTLQEIEQVAQCILLDFPVANIALLVQRIAELVTDNMGGPVKDANDMLARWLEKSTELRTSLQTSLLPIGCIKIGLSRHRALLFKVPVLPPLFPMHILMHECKQENQLVWKSLKSIVSLLVELSLYLSV